MKRYASLSGVFWVGGGLVALIFAWCLTGGARAQTADSAAADAQSQADGLQGDISRIQKKLLKATEQKTALETSLNQINTSLTSTQQAIERTRLLLAATVQTIAAKEQEIANLEDQLGLERRVLRGLIQDMYYEGYVPFAEMILTREDMADLFQGNDNLLSTEEKMQEVIRNIRDTQARVTDQKASLEDTKKDHETLIQIKNQQKQSLVAAQVDTRANLDDTQTIIDRLNKQLSQLQSDLNGLLGKSYSASDVWSAVKAASKQTGVPRGVLMGFLGTETHFASNVGTGTYKKDMNPDQRSVFEKICESLGINPSKQPVSKRVCYNPKAKDGCGGWGGAMGVAQFIPSTWMGYTDDVSSITGNTPANPWSLTDGITAMALKLKRTPGITSGSKKAVSSAACSYLGSCSQSYINSVYYWMDNYQQILN